MDCLRRRRLVLGAITLCLWASAWTVATVRAWTPPGHAHDLPVMCPMHHAMGETCPMRHVHDAKTALPDGAAHLRCGCADESRVGLFEGTKARLAAPLLAGDVEPPAIVVTPGDAHLVDGWTPPPAPPPRS